MRKTLFAAAACAAVLWTGCSKSESVTVTIANPLAIERTGEMVEISVNDIYTRLDLSDTAQFVIYDEKAQEVPYQLTYDEKVIFPVSVASNATVNYTVQQELLQWLIRWYMAVVIRSVWTTLPGRMTVLPIVHTVRLCRRAAKERMDMMSLQRMWKSSS